jgi:hypothetical protein
MPMAIAFTVSAGLPEWDEALAGWRCSALAIPGAAIDALYAEGERIDSDRYQVPDGLGYVRWIHGSPHPKAVTIAIKLTKELSTKELTVFWQKAAIVLPVLATILVALIAALLPLPKSASGASSTFNMWTIKGAVKPPSASEYSAHDVYTFVMPPDLRLNPDYTFEGALPIETRAGKLVLPKILLALKGKVNYEPPVIHLLNPGERLPTGARDAYDQRIDESQHVIEIQKPIEFRLTTADPPYTPSQTASPITLQTGSPPARP